MRESEARNPLTCTMIHGSHKQPSASKRLQARLRPAAGQRVKSRKSPCKYPATLACLFVGAASAVLLLSTPLESNCQRYTQGAPSGANQQPQKAANCNQQHNNNNNNLNHQRQRHHQSQEPAQQPQPQRQQRSQQLHQANERHQYLLQQAARLQHQNQVRSAELLQLREAPVSGQLLASEAPGLEHEEFSLANAVTAPTISAQQQILNSNYTLLAAPSSGNPQASDQQTGTANQTAPAAGSPTTQSRDLQQESSATPNLNTTPAVPSDSIGSPPLQPPTTTNSPVTPTVGQAAPTAGSKGAATATSSLPNSPQTDAETQHSQPAGSLSSRQANSGRRINSEDEELASQARGRQQANSLDQQHLAINQLMAGGQFHQARPEELFAGASGAPASLAQPVSASPSSISVITPLMGPPTQLQAEQQHQAASISAAGAQSTDSQSMMKPIFVLGQPLSERDYSTSTSASSANSQLYFSAHQPGYQTTVDEPQPAAKATVTPPPPAPAAKVLEQQAGEPQPPAQHAHQAQPQPQSKPASARLDKSAENEQEALAAAAANNSQVASYPSSSMAPMGERMSGPPLIYSDGHLKSSLEPTSYAQPPAQQSNASLSGPQAPSPRLFQGPSGNQGTIVSNTNPPRRPSLPPPVNQANAASGFRSPLSPSGPLLANQPAPSVAQPASASQQQQQQLQAAANSHMGSFFSNLPPYTNNMLQYNPNQMSGMSGAGLQQQQQQGSSMVYNAPKPSFPALSQSQQQVSQTGQSQVSVQQPGLIPGNAGAMLPPPNSGRRPLNITRVEHISAECSNNLIRAVIVFNGTFKGIIYSSGYVSDPTCLYINGTGSTRYEFNIRLNQCGTLGREELHQPTIPGEARRRDQVMWNTLSIQYNAIIEQEWDEHFRVSCEYGSDFWKTVSFSPFSVETNTGSPVVFTINPPQCQMDVLLGHGMGPKIAVDGPVTVGDPLTLLIHMKSEKAGYDILVKNCVAHNGAKQRMQLIDSNGCVVNERFISPFRGTYNDNDLRHVTLYAYLKAFRFTGTSVLYLECEIHMCQSACPPQMCYWRRLSKRSVDNSDYEYTSNSSSTALDNNKQLNEQQPVISDSLNLFKALQVRQGSEAPLESRRSRQAMREIYAEDDEAALVCYRHTEVFIFLTSIASLIVFIITIAVTCWLRIRKLTRSQFKHNRLITSSSSLSPSLLSISDAISSSASSFLNQAAGGSLLSLSPHHQMNHKSTATHLVANQCNSMPGQMMHHSSLHEQQQKMSLSSKLMIPHNQHLCANKNNPPPNISFFHLNASPRPNGTRLSPPHRSPVCSSQGSR